MNSITIVDLQSLRTGLELTIDSWMLSGRVEKEYFRLLYNTGCRPSEGLNCHNWKVTETGKIEIYMSKTKSYRSVDPATIPRVLLECIMNDINIFQTYNYQHMLRMYKQISPLALMKVKESYIQMYSFRHHYVKSLVNKGWPDERIIAHMGWNEDKSFQEYAKSRLYIG